MIAALCVKIKIINDFDLDNINLNLQEIAKRDNGRWNDLSREESEYKWEHKLISILRLTKKYTKTVTNSNIMEIHSNSHYIGIQFTNSTYGVGLIIGKTYHERKKDMVIIFPAMLKHIFVNMDKETVIVYHFNLKN